MVRLKNGTEAEQAVVTAAMLSLHKLWKEGVAGQMAIWELREIARKSQYSPVYGDRLKQLGLLEGDGRLHDSIKNIVLSAVEGESLEIMISSPI